MDTLPGHIVTFNSGSSTLKFDVYDVSINRGKKIATGSIDHIGLNPRFIFSSQTINVDTVKQDISNLETAVISALEYIALLNPHLPFEKWVNAFGIRIVHGGKKITKPTTITEDTLVSLERLAALAHLHNKPAIKVIRTIKKHTGNTIPCIGVFDTNFHRTIPLYASTYAIPRQMSQTFGITRFGFHGLAHEYMLERFAELTRTPRNLSSIITLQLGSGASVCAIQDGVSIDTSMGFTPMEGLMMRTRAGDMDPGVIFHIARSSGMSVPQLEKILNTESGLAGVSGTDGDTKTLIAAYHKDSVARLAIDMFVYRIVKYIGSYLAVLRKPKGIVFGGGIGEHAPFIRERVLEGLNHIGINLDRGLNNATTSKTAKITKSDSVIDAWVIPVDESKLILRYVRDYLNLG